MAIPWSKKAPKLGRKKRTPSISVSVANVVNGKNPLPELDDAAKEALGELVQRFEKVAGKYTPKGRTLRKAADRPRPDLPAGAPANRKKKQIALTLPPDLIRHVREQCDALGIDRNSLIEFAIRQTLKID